MSHFQRKTVSHFFWKCFRFLFQGALECRFLPGGEIRLSLRHINMAPIYEGSFRLKDTSAASGGM
ncbi:MULTISPECIES: hypothetical protein [unclassified Brucella]|uniref:hypothetical protein n=1 Tax=unclassified Brucella TaxID=2632610 RepID=UPI000972860A|nr:MULTISPECIES: hypothetical protein [unclassified Brucella]APX68767.1 hypothetical protein BKD03_05080 [Brucella sp. 09RB8471]MRN77499.1 hypothetical protein [Brucella sp. 10RB9210]